MTEKRHSRKSDSFDETQTTKPKSKRAYSPPASVQLSGNKDDEYGALIAAAAVWVIGIGPAWIW